LFSVEKGKIREINVIMDPEDLGEMNIEPL
jgi:hypothetical protein